MTTVEVLAANAGGGLRLGGGLSPVPPEGAAGAMETALGVRVPPPRPGPVGLEAPPVSPGGRRAAAAEEVIVGVPLVGRVVLPTVAVATAGPPDGEDVIREGPPRDGGEGVVAAPQRVGLVVDVAGERVAPLIRGALVVGGTVADGAVVAVVPPLAVAARLARAGRSTWPPEEAGEPTAVVVEGGLLIPVAAALEALAVADGAVETALPSGRATPLPIPPRGVGGRGVPLEGGGEASTVGEASVPRGVGLP